jgi:hypothetical protein
VLSNGWLAGQCPERRSGPMKSRLCNPRVYLRAVNGQWRKVVIFEKAEKNTTESHPSWGALFEGSCGFHIAFSAELFHFG